MTARDDDDGAGGDDDVGGHPRFSDRPGAAHVVNSHVTLNVPKCFVLVGLLCGHVVLPPAAAAWGGVLSKKPVGRVTSRLGGFWGVWDERGVIKSYE